MNTEEASCGQELASSAELPEALATLFTHVAANMEAHAEWVGTASVDARRENEALWDIVGAYRALAGAADRAATTMRGMRDIPAVPHIPERRPPSLMPAAQAEWMRRKIELQRDLARMLLEHAEESEQVLAGLRGPAAAD